MKTVPVAAYYRMSSDQQGGSIEDQIEDVVPWAKKQGYKIVATYRDDGLSAVKNLQGRKQFQRLLADAKSKKFAGIICWDTSRFSRDDIIANGSTLDYLREHGIWLDTVEEGKSDWTTSEGVLISALRHHSNHEYSKKLSSAVSRGRRAALERGSYPHGAVPYGYDRLYQDPTGKEHLIPRRTKFTMAKDWKRKVVKNEQEAAIVLRIFEHVAKGGSVSSLVKILNTEGHPGPGGGKWRLDAFENIVRNPAYLGRAHFGRKTPPPAKKPKFNSIGKLEKDNILPPIVAQDLFDKVHTVKEGRRHRNYRPRETSGLLSGTLYCGHCGNRLAYHLHKWQDGTERPLYRCRTSSDSPEDGHTCKQWRVYEDQILPVVLQSLVELIDKEAVEERIRLDRKKTLDKKRSNANDQKKQLTTQLAKLKKRVEVGTVNYLQAAPEIRADLETVLREWRTEVARLETALQEVENSKGEVYQWIEWWRDFAKPVFLEWQQDGSTEERIVERADARKLLEDAGLRVDVFWRRRVVTRKGETYESTRSEVDHTRLRARIEQDTLTTAGKLTTAYRERHPRKDLTRDEQVAAVGKMISSIKTKERQKDRNTGATHTPQDPILLTQNRLKNRNAGDLRNLR